jgi:trimeric autotransporter adhesin
MRRFVTLAFVLFFTVSFGVSISGCSKKTAVAYCNGLDSGPILGQLDTITLAPRIYGISLNYAQMGSVGAPSGADCKGNPVSVGAYTYGTVDANGKPDMSIADVVPSGPLAGRLCAGTWNRNTGGGIPDYTTCVPNNKSGTTYVVASADGASSNALPVYVHSVVTSVLLGPLSTDCLNDPATNCSPAAFIGSQTSCTIDAASGCCTAPVTTSATAFDATQGCLSQGATGQLAARVFAGTGTAQTNISCKVGHLTYQAQASTVVSIDQNGVATALQPGSTTISASVANAGSSAGFFSTCPPASISLSVPPGGGHSVTVNQSFTQPLAVTAVDTKGSPLTGLSLEYVSTTPTTIPGGGSITPLFPGAASITAICQPPGCNPSPFNQIGLFGNGKPVTSNPVTVTTPGTNSTVLFIGSTQSQYIVPVDFTTNVVGAPIRLPYAPNSMVISNDGQSVYMGSSVELMTFSAQTIGQATGLTGQDLSVTGKVLAVSPDSATLVITDPIRKLVYLYKSSGGVETTYGGVATHAEFTPDSSTVYITLGDVDALGNVTPNNQLLIHSSSIGWYLTTSTQATADVAVTVPSVGAFFAGSTTSAKGYCPVTTETTVGGQTTTSNLFYPDASVSGPATDRVTATNDGLHILGARAAGSAATFTDLLLGTGLPTGACPGNNALTFTATPVLANVALPGVTATAITGVNATSDSSMAFVTYLGSGGVLPLYKPSAGGAGTLSNIPLAVTSSGTPTAPVAGVVSADNSTFFVGTSGDNAVHLINRSTLTDDPTKAIVPKLPGANGNPVTPDLLVQKPRKSIS